MVTYITLCNFTEQGAREIKETTRRADKLKELAGKFGVTMKGIYWTVGGFDVVTIAEAGDDASILSFGLAVRSAGQVHFQALKAFSREEMNDMLARLA
jgi:uncharacterized protein with GYD domain